MWKRQIPVALFVTILLTSASLALKGQSDTLRATFLEPISSSFSKEADKGELAISDSSSTDLGDTSLTVATTTPASERVPILQSSLSIEIDPETWFIVHNDEDFLALVPKGGAAHPKITFSASRFFSHWPDVTNTWDTVLAEVIPGQLSAELIPDHVEIPGYGGNYGPFMRLVEADVFLKIQLGDSSARSPVGCLSSSLMTTLQSSDGEHPSNSGVFGECPN